MNLISILNKIKIITKFKFLKKEKLFDNVYFIGNIQDKNYKKIIFYFPNPTFMHLGDHVFFEPTIKLINDLKDFEVNVLPTKMMIDYFKNSNLKVIDSLDDISNALIITRPEFCLELENINMDKLYINTAFYDSDLPMCNDIAFKIFSFLGLNLNVKDLGPSQFIPKSNIKLDNGSKYFIFSNYVDSAFYRITNEKNQKLIDESLKIKNQGFKIIHIGTQKDKDNDNNEYNFIDIDLRGKTSINDLFFLSSLNNVFGGICYDSFIMHLLIIFRKEVKVLFRGRFLEKNKNFIIDKTIPPFIYNSNIILLNEDSER